MTVAQRLTETLGFTNINPRFQPDIDYMPTALRRQAEQVTAAYTAAAAALAEVRRLADPNLDLAADKADRATVAASAPAPGRAWKDPGTPAATQLAADRDRANRAAIALAEAYRNQYADLGAAIADHLDTDAGSPDDAATDLAHRLEALLPAAHEADVAASTRAWLETLMTGRDPLPTRPAGVANGAASAALRAAIAALTQQ